MQLLLKVEKSSLDTPGPISVLGHSSTHHCLGITWAHDKIEDALASKRYSNARPDLGNEPRSGNRQFIVANR
jgi:hypothetical protein